MCLGLNKQTVAATVLLLFTTTASGQEVKSYKYRFDGNLNDKSILNSGHSLIINYSINELELETIEEGNAVYYRIRIPGHTPTYDPGKPELPVLSRIINIPRGIDYRIIISDVRYSRLHPSSKRIKGILYPAQETESKNSAQRKKDFKLDRVAYSAKGILPYDTVRIEPLGTLRGNELANLIIAPVRYNPRTNSIEVISSMKIEITNIVPAESKSAGTAEESAVFTEALEKSVLNYSAGDVIPGFSDEPVKMIILTDTTYKKFLAPYVKWKTRKGFKVQVLYRGKKYAGDTYTEIKSTLTSIYNASTPAPEYLLIIGDTKKVPYYGTGNITDMYYGEFTGNGDYIPEMLIGRLPVSDTTQLKAVLNKLLQYEQYQFAPSNDFTSRALISAGNDDSNSKIMNGQVYYAINNYLNSSNKLTEYHFYYPKAAASEDSIRKIIRKGVGFINYTGHGDVTGWLDPFLKSGDIDTVTNTNMHPL